MIMIMMMMMMMMMMIIIITIITIIIILLLLNQPLTHQQNPIEMTTTQLKHIIKVPAILLLQILASSTH